MIQCETADECIKKIKKSLTDGADAFGIQLCVLKREYRDEETLKRIFSACGDKPIYATSYRCKESEGMSDDECAELLLRALKCGATLLDVMGDAYDVSPQYQLAQSDKKLLFFVSDKGQIIRYIGPSFGVCMYLCVQDHGKLDTPEQPVLKKLKAVRDNILL